MAADLVWTKFAGQGRLCETIRAEVGWAYDVVVTGNKVLDSTHWTWRVDVMTADLHSNGYYDFATIAVESVPETDPEIAKEAAVSALRTHLRRLANSLEPKA